MTTVHTHTHILIDISTHSFQQQLCSQITFPAIMPLACAVPLCLLTFLLGHMLQSRRGRDRRRLQMAVAHLANTSVLCVFGNTFTFCIPATKQHLITYSECAWKVRILKVPYHTHFKIVIFHPVKAPCRIYY